jgi:hypothetical protein
MRVAIQYLVASAMAVSVVAFAAPSFAQHVWRDGNGGVQVSRERAEALRSCNELAARTYRGNDNDGNRRRFYGACMAEHGQAE